MQKKPEIKIEFLNVKGNWREVADSARTTINLGKGKKEPSSEWKYKMLLAEHSPIRQISIHAKWINIPYWVSVHFVRHKIGIEHWVRTQRSDRTKIDRSNLPQGALVEHEILATAQSIINISRKRLCSQASKETRNAWILLLKELQKKEPEIFNACVPECVYRGWCPEYKSCGFHRSSGFTNVLLKYRKNIN